MVRLDTKIKYVLAAAVLFVLAAITAFSGGAFNVDAATSFSNVLDDLRKDPAFDVEEYPAIKGDGSLNVIQIAESTDGDLLVYVYQPGAPSFGYKAKSINIAREPDNSINLDFKNYWLTYVNSAGVFYKYKVDNFKVNSDPARYYNVSNILRPWDRYIDMNVDNGNTISDIPYTVGQYWTVTGTGDDVSYSMTTSEVVQIEDKYVGYVNYTDGVKIKWNGMAHDSTDAHFVAFSTDRQIDKLLSVKLTYNEQLITCKYCCNIAHNITSDSHGYKSYFNVKKGDAVPTDKEITYSEKGGNVGGGNFVHADPYAWYRIRTTSEFLADENNVDYKLTKGTTDNVKNTQWVLSFTETQRYFKTNDNDAWQFLNPIGDLFIGDTDIRYSIVSDVMLLQLVFETDGQTYKLGVVDNKQTGGNTPGNEPTPENPINQTKKQLTIGAIISAVVTVIIGVILLCVFFPEATPYVLRFLKIIGQGLLWLLKGLWWLISLPFKAISNAIKRRKATAATKSKPRKTKSRSKKK